MNGGIRDNRRLKRVVLSLTDLLIVAFSIALALLFRFDWRVPSKDLGRFLRWSWALILIYVGLFNAAGFYKVTWRTGGYREMLALFLAAAGGTACTLLFNWITRVGLSRRTLALTGVNVFALLVCSRYAWILLRNVLLGDLVSRTKRRALIVGTGPKGRNLVLALKEPVDGVIHLPLVFADDDVEMVYRAYEGVPIEGLYGDIPQLIRKYSLDEVILSARPADRRVGRQLLELCAAAGVDTLRPTVADGRVTGLRPVEMEDMLYPPPFEPDEEALCGAISGKTVFVAGAGGVIGAKMCELIAARGPARILLFDCNESNLNAVYQALRPTRVSLVPVLGFLQDEERLCELFSQYGPALALHCAGGKNAEMLQMNPRFARANESQGMAALLSAAKKSGMERLLYCSCDEAESSRGALGAAKRQAERLVCEAEGLIGVALRFGSVMEPSGVYMSLYARQIAAGGPVTVSNPDALRYLVTLEDAAAHAVEVGLTSETSGVRQIDLGEPMRVREIVETLIRMQGKTPAEDIEIRDPAHPISKEKRNA